MKSTIPDKTAFQIETIKSLQGLLEFEAQITIKGGIREIGTELWSADNRSDADNRLVNLLLQNMPNSDELLLKILLATDTPEDLFSILKTENEDRQNYDQNIIDELSQDYEDVSWQSILLKRHTKLLHAYVNLLGEREIVDLITASDLNEAQTKMIDILLNKPDIKKVTIKHIILAAIRRKHPNSNVEELRRARKLLKNKNVRDRLCPALEKCATDIFTVTVTVSSVLWQSSLSGVNLGFSITPVLCASLGMLIARMGISIVCADA